MQWDDYGEKSFRNDQRWYQGRGYVTRLTKYRNGDMVRMVGIARVNDVFAPRTARPGGMQTLDLTIQSFTRKWWR